MGMMGEAHAVFRVLCVCGALLQCPFDAISAMLVGEYIDQVQNYNAPNGNYSDSSRIMYYWLDISSFGLCVLMCMLGLHLCCIVGFVQAPYVTYQSISGGSRDRLLVLDEESDRRKQYDVEQQRRFEHLQYEEKKQKNASKKNWDEINDHEWKIKSESEAAFFVKAKKCAL